jgi:hypothetical protein
MTQSSSKKQKEKSKPTLNLTKSPSRIKKTSNSNSNTHKNSPFGLDKTKTILSINQKRTHSVKKNLNEIFDKLKLNGM